MSDSSFTPKLGRIRDPGRARALRHTQRVLGEAVKTRPLQRASHIGPNAFKRGLAHGAVAGSGLFVPGTRRVIVKARYTRHKPGELGAARAHLRYIQRDGVTREGHPGKLYDASGSDADSQAFLERSDLRTTVREPTPQAPSRRAVFRPEASNCSPRWIGSG